MQLTPATPGRIRIVLGPDPNQDCHVIDDKGNDLTKQLHIESIAIVAKACEPTRVVLTLCDVEVEAQVDKQQLSQQKKPKP